MALPDWAISGKDGKFSSRKGGVLAQGVSLNALAGLFQLIGSLFSTFLLARLITAEDFGVYNVVLPFVTIFTILADGGSMYHTLRNSRVDERELSFSFWYGVIISLVLSACMFPLAPLIADLMGEPRAEAAALGSALAIFAIGVGFQHNALIMRCFRNDLRAITIIVSVSISVVLAIVVAIFGGGYWALVTLFVSRTALQTMVAWYLTRWIPRLPRPNLYQLKQILTLGLPELYSRLLLNIVRDADKVLVGILSSTLVTGYYGLAHMLCILPLRQILSPIFAVVIPYLSESRDDRQEFYTRFQRLFRLFVFALWPAGAFFALYADVFTRLVVGAEMAPAARFVAPLLLAGIVSMSGSFVSIAFQAMDRPGMTARHNTVLIFITIYCLFAAALLGTPMAVALAILVANLLSLRLRWREFSYFFKRRVRTTLAQLWTPIAMTVFLPGLVWFCDHRLGLQGFLVFDALYAIALLVLFGAFTFIAGVLLFRNEAQSVYTRLRNRRKRKAAASTA